MALEQLSLAASATVDGDWDGSGASNGRQVGGGDEGAKTARLPRWTRQEILILIQGKRVAESRVRRRGSLDIGSLAVQVEPKWAAVSSYCKNNGVNRGPVQCRKRWSNLAGDFKKIKEYESQVKDETESFWLLRNDFRRERKLPGFFDKEVYDILAGSGGDGVGVGVGEAALALALAPSAANDGGLFSDFEYSGQEGGGGGGGSPDKDIPMVPADKEAGPSSISAPTPISFEKQYEPFTMERPAQGTSNEKEPVLDSEIGGGAQGERKRKRHATDDVDEETTNLQQQLIEALERNGNLVSSQLEAQNSHYQLGREQQKDHMNSLIKVLDKVADALGRIADKL